MDTDWGWVLQALRLAARGGKGAGWKAAGCACGNFIAVGDLAAAPIRTPKRTPKRCTRTTRTAKGSPPARRAGERLSAPHPPPPTRADAPGHPAGSAPSGSSTFSRPLVRSLVHGQRSSRSRVEPRSTAPVKSASTSVPIAAPDPRSSAPVTTAVPLHADTPPHAPPADLTEGKTPPLPPRAGDESLPDPRAVPRSPVAAASGWSA